MSGVSLWVCLRAVLQRRHGSRCRLALWLIALWHTGLCLGSFPLLAQRTLTQNSSAPSVLDVPRAPPSSAAEALRRALAYAEQMRPAGLLATLGSAPETIAKLERTPELRRAVELASLDMDGTLPYHLHGTFVLNSEIGHRRGGTIDADRYNDRWSRLVVTLDGVRSSTMLLDGRRVTDDRFPAVPFGLQRLLRALFNPLGNVVANKVPLTQDTVQQDGETLRCTLLGKQVPPDPGMAPMVRSACVDADGDLRLDVLGYGFRIVSREFRPLGVRRIPTDVQVLQGDAPVAELHLEVRVAGELTPASFAVEGVHEALPTLRFCWTPLPWQIRNDMETLDAHIVPKDDSTFKQHVPVVVARILAGTDGRLVDVEVLGEADPTLRQQVLRVLRASIFRQREWKGEPVSIEGVLVLGRP